MEEITTIQINNELIKQVDHLTMRNHEMARIISAQQEAILKSKEDKEEKEMWNNQIKAFASVLEKILKELKLVREDVKEALANDKKEVTQI